ncbi:tol-pal system protein YbgF [Gymnodinialimonas sp. 2305UL16-5]|uniref:tol-pal system protein YbgF n=1 Tax=Gymnodinialimonas mytili TaxID=3126503 RepID=UPI0030A2CE64
MRFVAAILVCLIAGPVMAQDRTQTLADIRQELSVLFVEIQRLRGELNTTGGAAGTGAGGGTLDRVNAIEAEVTRLTALTERLQINIDAIVRDGTNRIGDLEFRLCELEEDCDLSTLGDTPTLGGVDPVTSGTPAAPTATPLAAPTPGAAPATAGPTSPTPGLAVAEQGDFDRARAAFDEGNFSDAALFFQTFTETYPGSPLSAEAHFLRGEAEANEGRWSQAARAFLDSFTVQPDGERAPMALTALGVALAELGQSEEACLTLAEVSVRYPGDPSATAAETERTRLGCQ